jgi:hypothetical protein
MDADGIEIRSVRELQNVIYAGFRIRGSCQVLVQRSNDNEDDDDNFK